MLPKSLILLSLPFLVSASPAIPWHRPYPQAPSVQPQQQQPAPQSQQQPPRPQANFPAPKKETSNKSDVFRISEGNSVALFNGIPVDLATGHPIKVTNSNQNPGSGNSKLKTLSNSNAASSNTSNQRRDLRDKLGLGFLAAPNTADATMNAQQAFADSSVGRMHMSPNGPVGPPSPHANMAQYPHHYPPPPPPPTPQQNLPSTPPQQPQSNQEPSPPQQHNGEQKQAQPFPQTAPRQVAKFPVPQAPPPPLEGQPQQKPKLDVSKAIADNKDMQGNKWMVYNGKPMKLVGNEKPTRKALSLVADELATRDDDNEFGSANTMMAAKKSGNNSGRMVKRDATEPLNLVADHAAGQGPLDKPVAPGKKPDRRPPPASSQKLPTEPLSLVKDTAAGEGPLDISAPTPVPLPYDLDKKENIKPSPQQRKVPAPSRQPLNLVRDAAAGKGPLDQTGNPARNAKTNEGKKKDEETQTGRNGQPRSKKRGGVRKYPAPDRRLGLVADHASGQGPLEKPVDEKDPISSASQNTRPLRADKPAIAQTHPNAKPLTLVEDTAVGDGPLDKPSKSASTPKPRPSRSAMPIVGSTHPDSASLNLIRDHANGVGPIQKRDITEKLGLGMFDFRKSVKAVGNAAEHAAASNQEDEYEIVDPEEYDDSTPTEYEDNDDNMDIPSSSSINADAGRAMINHDDEADVTELPNAKSFAIYNGVPVEIDGKQVKNQKMKKPRPAFPRVSNNYQHNRNVNGLTRRGIVIHTLPVTDGPEEGPTIQLQRRSADAEPGKKVGGINPWQKNPVSSTRGSRPKTRESQLGETKSINVGGQEKIVRTPRTSEEETVRVLGGENYRLCNGKPCGKSGVGPF